MRADQFATIDRAELDPGHGTDRVLDEVDRAVAEECIDPARMPAPRPRERAPLEGLVVAPQASSRLTIALRARVGRAGALIRAVEARQVVRVVEEQRAG